jgi:Mycotoxin biosynthesis protein UstYa
MRHESFEDWFWPAVSGFVYLPHPEEYGLLPNTNVIAGAENVYSISAYHQLHCLKIMHLTFVELWNQESGDGRISLVHVEHCIAYIKQGIMCAGDTALERPDIGGGTLQGWGTEHECRTGDGENCLLDKIVDKILVLNDMMFKQGC